MKSERAQRKRRRQTFWQQKQGDVILALVPSLRGAQFSEMKKWT
jgi:hypothetical protein